MSNNSNYSSNKNSNNNNNKNGERTEKITDKESGQREQADRSYTESRQRVLTESTEIKQRERERYIYIYIYIYRELEELREQGKGEGEQGKGEGEQGKWEGKIMDIEREYINIYICI